MEEERGFYIVLPSNVQPDFHSNNTASAYQTTFPSSYQLPGEWEVALCEISYVNTIPTIVNETFSVNSSKLETNVKKHTFKLSNRMMFPYKKRRERTEGETADSNTSLMERDMTRPFAYHLFRPKSADCPFTVKFNKTTMKLEIKAVKEDIPPNVYLYKREAKLLKLDNPRGRVINNGDYLQLWSETLKKGETYYSSGTPQALGAAITISFAIKSTECLKIAIPKGYYPTADKLVEALNQETKNPLADWDKSEASEGKKACGYKFDYNKGENRIVLGLIEHTDLTFHDDLHSLLGFESKHQTNRRHTAEHVPLMNHGIYNIFIYCDLCASIRVGDVMVPLLRTVDVPSEQAWGKVVCTRFNRPMYIPISKSSFNSVRIELYDDAGKEISLPEGRTVLTLHIRPRKI